MKSHGSSLPKTFQYDTSKWKGPSVNVYSRFTIRKPFQFTTLNQRGPSGNVHFIFNTWTLRMLQSKLESYKKTFLHNCRDSQMTYCPCLRANTISSNLLKNTNNKKKNKNKNKNNPIISCLLFTIRRRVSASRTTTTTLHSGVEGLQAVQFLLGLRSDLTMRSYPRPNVLHTGVVCLQPLIGRNRLGYICAQIHYQTHVQFTCSSLSCATPKLAFSCSPRKLISFYSKRTYGFVTSLFPFFCDYVGCCAWSKQESTNVSVDLH